MSGRPTQTMAPLRSFGPSPASEDTAFRPSWEDQPVFRELFLAHAPSRLAGLLRAAGRVLYEDLLEAGLTTAATASGEGWVHARVRALALDLRFVGRVLTALAAEPRQASLDPEETSLAKKGDAWGREVEELARALEAAAGHGPGSGSEWVSDPGSANGARPGPGPGWSPGAGPGAGPRYPGKENS